MSVSGVSELESQLADLAERQIVTAIYGGLNAGLVVFRDAIVARAPVGKSKQLKECIGKRIIKGQSPGTKAGKAGVNVARANVPHAHLVTLGTADRYTKHGAYRGNVPVNTFVNQAFAAVANTAARSVIDRLRATIARAGA